MLFDTASTSNLLIKTRIAGEIGKRIDISTTHLTRAFCTIILSVEIYTDVYILLASDFHQHLFGPTLLDAKDLFLPENIPRANREFNFARSDVYSFYFCSSFCANVLVQIGPRVSLVQLLSNNISCGRTCNERISSFSFKRKKHQKSFCLMKNYEFYVVEHFFFLILHRHVNTYTCIWNIS